MHVGPRKVGTRLDGPKRAMARCEAILESGGASPRGILAAMCCPSIARTERDTALCSGLGLRLFYLEEVLPR